ncbi:39S ribosomal protein L21, mitochondrial [Trichuris trichiura]|uniref:Large ribosomal subunit protein bL21m n=1 Tax=Trichuris trichiura TaxID=36087 RepID=A0A077ZBP9_TRITR|nr:39S ribosomal protein L21, mitochondrial [Trichuris trichiura]
MPVCQTFEVIFLPFVILSSYFSKLTAKAQQSVCNSELPIYRSVISAVNEKIANRSHGHLFAVVKLGNRQFKVATEDIIVCEGHLPLSLGEKIFLEKVLCVGAKEFTLIGTPLLPKEKVRVIATCIEKTLSNLEIDYFFVRRKNISNLKLMRKALTLLRITDIELLEPLSPSETQSESDL